MNYQNLFKIAIRAIAANKMRSFPIVQNNCVVLFCNFQEDT